MRSEMVKSLLYVHVFLIRLNFHNGSFTQEISSIAAYHL